MKKAKQTHKYKKGAIVGVVVDCMCDCEVLRRLPKKKYILKAVAIHHPEPKKSWFGNNPKFIAQEKQILVCLKD